MLFLIKQKLQNQRKGLSKKRCLFFFGGGGCKTKIKYTFIRTKQLPLISTELAKYAFKMVN